MIHPCNADAGRYSAAVRWQNGQADIDEGVLCNSAGVCSLNVINSTFDGNRGQWAGAVYVDAKQSAIIIAACTFKDNVALVPIRWFSWAKLFETCLFGEMKFG